MPPLAPGWLSSFPALSPKPKPSAPSSEAGAGLGSGSGPSKRPHPRRSVSDVGIGSVPAADKDEDADADNPPSPTSIRSERILSSKSKKDKEKDRDKDWPQTPNSAPLPSTVTTTGAVGVTGTDATATTGTETTSPKGKGDGKDKDKAEVKDTKDKSEGKDGKDKEKEGKPRERVIQRVQSMFGLGSIGGGSIKGAGSVKDGKEGAGSSKGSSEVGRSSSAGGWLERGGSGYGWKSKQLDWEGVGGLLDREEEEEGAVVWCNPGMMQLVETLQTFMMTKRDPTEGVPATYNYHILHLIEGIGNMTRQLRKMEEELQGAKDLRDKELEQFRGLSEEWSQRESNFKAEIKRLELILARESSEGVASVALARHGSLVNRTDSRRFHARVKRLSSSRDQVDGIERAQGDREDFRQPYRTTTLLSTASTPHHHSNHGESVKKPQEIQHGCCLDDQKQDLGKQAWHQSPGSQQLRSQMNKLRGKPTEPNAIEQPWAASRPLTEPKENSTVTMYPKEQPDDLAGSKSQLISSVKWLGSGNSSAIAPGQRHQAPRDCHKPAISFGKSYDIGNDSVVDDPTRTLHQAIPEPDQNPQSRRNAAEIAEFPAISNRGRSFSFRRGDDQPLGHFSATQSRPAPTIPYSKYTEVPSSAGFTTLSAVLEGTTSTRVVPSTTPSSVIWRGGDDAATTGESQFPMPHETQSRNDTYELTGSIRNVNSLSEDTVRAERGYRPASSLYNTGIHDDSDSSSTSSSDDSTVMACKVDDYQNK